MRYAKAIDRNKHIADLWAEVSLIRSFQKVFDETDPIGRRARKIRLAQIARELRLMGETAAVSRTGAQK